MTKPHSLDLIAQDLADWIDRTATKLAEAMTEGGASPFAAQTTRQERLEYYTEQFFNPDGTPNEQGRQAQLARLGPEGFLRALRAVTKGGTTTERSGPAEGQEGPPEAIPDHPLMPDWLKARVPPPGPPSAVPMQHGGIVDRPTYVLLGEAGPEAVVPLTEQPDNPYGYLPHANGQIVPPSVVQGETPPMPRGMPLYPPQLPQALNTMRFESPDQVIAMADQLGLREPLRSQFILRYFDPRQGAPLYGRDVYETAPIPRSD